MLVAALLVLGIGYHYFKRFGLPSDSEDSLTVTAPKTGKVVFASNRDGDWDIWTMNPDGSDPVNLTRDVASDFKPTWSPTGEQILFVSFREDGESLYLMDADGNNIRRVFDNWHSRSSAAWAPDGKRIASARDGVLYILTIDNASIEPVAETGFASVGYPAWSPDGKEIAFIHYKPKQGYELRLLNVETLKQTVLLGEVEKYPVKFDPAWSPNGEQIAFVLHKFRHILSHTDALVWQDEETIYIINRDGSNLRQLVSEKGPDALHPTWSPDGNEIIYQQDIHLPEGGNIRQLFKIDVNTRAKTQLTHEGANRDADWFMPPASPDEP
ncbi:hypothetical protein F4009_07385 [Candidatus Poribacteria bacterium]|nr:hypothetical protein [Candidatus Poribacteria bacterium]MYK93811.1 hypothetical protein [Candidatus Poribacteria bacterium]